MTPKAIVRKTTLPGETSPVIEVCPVWEGVDRPTSSGWVLPATRTDLAERLSRAIEGGAACPNPVIKTDVNGKTYVNHGCVVLGRRMSADLKRLGY
jgi:hypothetical protein